MMKNDRDKLNQCLDILDSTDLGLSLVWLWTWSTVKNFMEDEDYKFNKSEEEVWDLLAGSVDSGHEFSLEYGSEEHFDTVQFWLLDNDIMEYVEGE
jgi:hypothetical protein